MIIDEEEKIRIRSITTILLGEDTKIFFRQVDKRVRLLVVTPRALDDRLKAQTILIHRLEDIFSGIQIKIELLDSTCFTDPGQRRFKIISQEI
jgi:hypothetical protein